MIRTGTNTQRPAGRVTAIASGKGGVGKTFLAVGLARALAKKGERVLLFDGDLGMANVDVQLGLAPPRDLGAVVSGKLTMAQAVSPALGGAEKGGFDVIAGRSGSGALAGLAAERASGLAAGLAALSLDYDRVLMDLAAGAEPALLRLAAAADDVLVVLMDEPASITDAYAFVKMLRMRDEGATPMAAVNMADSQHQARTAFEAFARTCRGFLDFDPVLAGAVRRDEAARAAVRRQQCVIDAAPKSAAAADIGRLADALTPPRAARAA